MHAAAAVARAQAAAQAKARAQLAERSAPSTISAAIVSKQSSDDKGLFSGVPLPWQDDFEAVTGSHHYDVGGGDLQALQGLPILDSLSAPQIDALDELELTAVPSPI